jgi:adenylate cyclase
MNRSAAEREVIIIDPQIDFCTGGALAMLAALEQAPGPPVAYQLLAACYAHMGRLDAAREILEQLRAITPVVVPRILPYRNPEERGLLLSGLRLAAGEAP